MIPEVTAQYQHWLSNMVFLDPQPATMRDYSFKTERRLGSDGANLSGVLFNLCREKGNEHEVLQFIRALPEQDIRSIDFIVDTSVLLPAERLHEHHEQSTAHARFENRFPPDEVLTEAERAASRLQGVQGRWW